MVVGFCGCLLFLFVPESFWDRTPIPKSRKSSKMGSRLTLSLFQSPGHESRKDLNHDLNHHPANEKVGTNDDAIAEKEAAADQEGITTPKKAVVADGPQNHRGLHVGFATDGQEERTNGDHAGGDEAVTPSSEATINPIDHEGNWTNLYGIHHRLTCL